MILPILLLSSALDFSLPEFQPETDISGNYIYTEIDTSSNEIEIVESAVLPDGLTSADGNSVVVRSGENVINYSTLQKMKFDYTNNVLVNNYNYSLHYITCEVGYTYTISTDASALRYTYSLTKDSPFYYLSDNPFTPNELTYVLVESSYNLSASFVSSGGDSPSDPSGNEPSDPSGNEPSDPSGNNPSGGGSYDDTSLLLTLYNIYILLRCILFVSIWNFLLPVAMKIRDHIFGLKHE